VLCTKKKEVLKTGGISVTPYFYLSNKSCNYNN